MYALTEEADDDLVAIWGYTVSKWGEEQAEKYLRNLHLDFERLANRRKVGRSCARLNPAAPGGLYYYLSGRHYVIYRFDGSTLMVLTVLHGSSQAQLEAFLTR